MRTLGGIVGAVKCINNVIAAIMTTKATKRRRNEIKRNKRVAAAAGRQRSWFMRELFTVAKLKSH